jgi:hypothetical protein
MQRLSGTAKGVQALGVTLCNEAYRLKAQMAARQFVACTGYPFPSYREVVTRFAGRNTPALTVKESGLAGVWHYERIGLDVRILEFRPDGTIGQGSANCEQYWRVWRQDGDLVLGLFGMPLDDTRVAKTLEARRDGDGAWRGHWLRAAQCPIVLRPQL